MAYIEKDFPIERLNPIAQKEGNAKKPIYQIHKWWARRLGSVFRMLILATFAEDDITEEELWRRFYSKNQLKNSDGKPPIILDPFMGGGTTIVEALRLGCKVIGIDLNPVAWFVTKKEIEPVDLDELDKAFRRLEQTIAPEILRYYKTTCPKGHEAEVMYIFWVKKVPCLACGNQVKLFPSFRIATKKGYHAVFCPNCYYVINGDLHTASKEELRQIDLNAEVLCPDCGISFVPSVGFSGRGKYTCPSCGQKDNVLNAVRTLDGPPPAEMFAIEYYCDTCGRGYKRVDDWDLELFEDAKQEFERRKDELLYPRQAIPTEGRSDPRPVNYGYKYFYQMFNERQLLCLSMLLEEILGIKDENLREYFILSLSELARNQNTFCNYLFERQHHEPLFKRHDYHVIGQYVEGNVWGAKLGRSSFMKTIDKLKKGKQYSLTPFERKSNGRHMTGDPAVAKLTQNVTPGDDNAILHAQSSEDLSFLPSKSVDSVITDPPYCDNVSYAELADFLHVWLRTGLSSQYAWFEPEITPRAREIIKNDAQGKDESFFFKALTRVLRESQRVLKDNGLLVFTFHHKEPWAWKGVLNSILEAGFYVHLFVIVMGRCLELYSKHWPDVMKDREKVDVDEAIDDIEVIVDSLIKSYELRQLPVALDEPTKLYLLYIAGRKDLTYDELNKRLQTGGGSLSEFIQRGYISRKEKSLTITRPKDRLELIERDMDRGRPLSTIDIAHYLYAIYEQGKPIQRHIGRWASDELAPVLELLYKKSGDRVYSRLAEHVRGHLSSGRPRQETLDFES